MKLVSSAAIMNGSKNLHPSFRGTKSEPAGDCKGCNPMFSEETAERPSMLSQCMPGSTCGRKMCSDARELAVDPGHQELRKVLRELSKLREIAFGKRLQLKEKRNELRQERVLLADVDGDFMKSIRRFPEQDHFEFEDEHYVQLEQQRDIVGSLQYDYDQAEDEYDMDENDLESEEGRLDILLSKYLNGHSDADDEHTTKPSLDSHLQPEESQLCNVEDEARVSLAEYQSRVGDARILEERLQDLWSEQEERHNFAKKREVLGGDLGGSDEDFTESFDHRYSEIVGELDVIYADIEQLKDGLIQAGHVFPKTSPTDRPPEVLAYQASSPPRPACSPIARQRSLSESILQGLQKNLATTRAHISRWVLKTFGSSKVECARHKEILRRLGDGSLDDEDWARLVLEHWKKAECDGDDDTSRGSWDEILPADFMENTPQDRGTRIRTPVLLSGRSEATHAMNDFMQHFPISTPGDHARPYAAEVELDELLEYESRSV